MSNQINKVVKREELCLQCGDVTPTLVDVSAAAIVYRCSICGRMVDWDVVDDPEFESEMHGR